MCHSAVKDNTEIEQWRYEGKEIGENKDEETKPKIYFDYGDKVEGDNKIKNRQ